MSCSCLSIQKSWLVPLTFLDHLWPPGSPFPRVWNHWNEKELFSFSSRMLSQNLVPCPFCSTGELNKGRYRREFWPSTDRYKSPAASLWSKFSCSECMSVLRNFIKDLKAATAIWGFVTSRLIVHQIQAPRQYTHFPHCHPQSFTCISPTPKQMLCKHWHKNVWVCWQDAKRKRKKKKSHKSRFTLLLTAKNHFL